MKFVKYLLLLVVIVALPLIVFAEEDETGEVDEVDTRAIVYFFHGATCSHCAEARSWFESIQEEYGDKFRLVEYEVWSDEDNAELMQKVSDFRGDDATGVPYILCGDKSWIGFSESTMAPEILAQIESVYETDVSDRYDIIKLVGSN